MSWYGIDNLDDALEATTGFLTPVDWRTWIKLAVVVFFLGGSTSGFNAGQANVPSGGQQEWAGAGPGAGPPVPPMSELIALVEPWMIALGGLVMLVVLFFQFVGAVMEFVLFAALREQQVTIRRFWGRHWRRGLRLFGFRLVVNLAVLATVAVLIGMFVLPMLGISVPSLPIAALVVLVPLVILLALVLSVGLGFTTVFVAPIMMLEDRGVVAGWKRFWPTLRNQWKQFAVYAVINLVLSIAGGIAAMLAGLVALVVLLIPFGILGALAFGLFTVSHLAGIGLGVVVGILFVLSLGTAFTLIRVPVVTYLRYYALLVLGDAKSAFDLIPDQREAIRTR